MIAGFTERLITRFDRSARSSGMIVQSPSLGHFRTLLPCESTLELLPSLQKRFISEAYLLCPQVLPPFVRCVEVGEQSKLYYPRFTRIILHVR